MSRLPIAHCVCPAALPLAGKYLLILQWLLLRVIHDHHVVVLVLAPLRFEDL